MVTLLFDSAVVIFLFITLLAAHAAGFWYREVERIEQAGVDWVFKNIIRATPYIFKFTSRQ